jgi:hypothetical protein
MNLTQQPQIDLFETAKRLCRRWRRRRAAHFRLRRARRGRALADLPTAFSSWRRLLHEIDRLSPAGWTDPAYASAILAEHEAFKLLQAMLRAVRREAVPA